MKRKIAVFCLQSSKAYRISLVIQKDNFPWQEISLWFPKDTIIQRSNKIYCETSFLKKKDRELPPVYSIIVGRDIKVQNEGNYLY